MTTQLPRTATSYVEAINNHDPAAFLALFADDAIVDDAGREFRGLEAHQNLERPRNLCRGRDPGGP